MAQVVQDAAGNVTGLRDDVPANPEEQAPDAVPETPVLKPDGLELKAAALVARSARTKLADEDYVPFQVVVDSKAYVLGSVTWYMSFAVRRDMPMPKALKGLMYRVTYDARNMMFYVDPYRLDGGFAEAEEARYA